MWVDVTLLPAVISLLGDQVSLIAVYLLTDAERTTGTYSNRFAAHVLRHVHRVQTELDREAIVLERAQAQQRRSPRRARCDPQRRAHYLTVIFASRMTRLYSSTCRRR